MENKNYFKKLSKDFNQYAEQDTWNKTYSIKIEHSALFPVNEVGRGPNSGEPTLLNFETRIIEAKSIYFHYESKYSSLQIFYTSSTDNYPDDYFIEVRKSNKTQSIKLNQRASDNELPYLIKQLKGNQYVYRIEGYKELLEANGYSIVTCFGYTGQIQYELPHHFLYSIQPKYIKELNRGIELGFISSGTYNSLPHVLKITKSRGIKSVPLSDLGIETSGYYSHHYNCEIKQDQAIEAKKFFNKRFKAS